MDEKLDLANDIVKSHVVYSLGAGLVPIPLLDIAAVSAVQVDMLKQLAKLYGQDFKESAGKGWISAITGSALARMGSSFVKAVPGIGTILGGVTMSALSGASTFAIGQVFIRHFSSGGDFFNFNLEKAKKIYEQEFDKGKRFATDLEKKQKERKRDKDDVFEKLEKLAQLKEKGVISEEDYQTQKNRLLSEI
jgi:uncharacterized protein (DUF697 family)